MPYFLPERKKIVLALLLGSSLLASFNSVQCKENTLKGGTISGAGKGDAPDKVLSDWMTFYYLKPQPDKVPYAIKNFCMLSDAIKSSARMPFAAFLSFVFKQNPGRVKNWVTSVGTGEVDKLVICHALYLSNNDECKQEMSKLADTLSAPKKKIVLATMAQKAPDLKVVSIDSPGLVDMLWAAFMATGDDFYVKRIIGLLPDLKSKDQAKLLIATMARWSLLSNCEQHAKVKQIYKGELKKHPEYATLIKVR